MRAEAARNAIRLKAYAGTTGVMLAMNVTNTRRTGLLGFAVERERPDGKHRWLSRGLREKLLAFIERAQGAGWAIDVAIYEFELPEVVDSLESALRRGADVRVVYHAKAGDPQTAENERHLARLPERLKKARVTASIFHQKFAVLSRVAADGRREPEAVLTGSTNFTANVVYRQANVVHIVEDPALAEVYLDLCEMMRLYDHYRFRFNQESPTGRGPAKRLLLAPDDGWTGRYFGTGNLLAAERERFCPMKLEW